ncbi:hypothetical protein ATCV1_Z225R [Acanthocystis turfacea chlorella virus 1]|uniref:Uncharacterized protein Z225R n=1 Tax=Chlorovirus heliozoae TaxID=322019 RepID=A7K8I5_9PHYC|nr:hypothetical protein ATCV1_Z225R [Acanthocystis turfacea chlorella virus 1]ABT16359.1 hypothetical protein ATCV1_Z225R [Acanthocystis turfacea chlorella virus 1]AGE49438.1 hypothetical protein ATCVCan0610SP_268R [Acanthocystis turfacea Chlorella virus Can0610SP]
MKTLKYYWEDGSLTVFYDYAIDERSTITNVKINHVMSQRENADGYNKVSLSHEETRRTLVVARALASTFLGPPPTLQHTADHKDKNSFNDTLDNIRWLDKPGQSTNQKKPTEYKSAFIIVKDGVELTAKEWLDVFKKPDDKPYSKDTIQRFAREQLNDFRYKIFPNLRGEVWKPVPGSKNSQGEWLISNKNRMKYKTPYAENVLTVDQLTKKGGYPVVQIIGKKRKCHHLSMMAFRPREYVAKCPGDIILHKNDDPLDFNPFRLRWGTSPENGKEAHKNGKHDGSRYEQKPVASYINGVLEKKHESIRDTIKYLREIGYSDAYYSSVRRAIYNDVSRYGRTWKFV